MRKLIALVVALSAGIGAGFGSSELWVRARVLPYCKVANNADSYHMRFVRVKAKLYIHKDGTSIYENCDPVEALAAFVEYEGGQPAFSGSSQLKTADAIIEGEFNAQYSSGCWGPKFHIMATKIELTSPVVDFVPPVSESDGPALRLKH